MWRVWRDYGSKTQQEEAFFPKGELRVSCQPLHLTILIFNKEENRNTQRLQTQVAPGSNGAPPSTKSKENSPSSRAQLWFPEPFTSGFRAGWWEPKVDILVYFVNGSLKWNLFKMLVDTQEDVIRTRGFLVWRFRRKKWSVSLKSHY